MEKGKVLTILGVKLILMIYGPVLSNAQTNQIKEETMVTKTLAIPNPSALNLAGPDISIDVDNMNSNAVLEYIADQGGYDIVFVKSNPTYTRILEINKQWRLWYYWEPNKIYMDQLKPKMRVSQGNRWGE